MNVVIRPGKAAGSVAAPASKSMAHRLLICAGLARGTSRIRGVEKSQDILATIDCLQALGASCAMDGDTVTVTGADLRKAAPARPLPCRESGSTLRFFIPPALMCGRPVAFTGSEMLLSRPLDVYRQLAMEKGFSFSRGDTGLQVQGPLTGGIFPVPGDISSQFISGLLFALPLAEQDSSIRITTEPESKSYIDLTLQALEAFGIRACWQDSRTILIPGRQQYRPAEVSVEGDYSGAAFYQALNALGSHIEITGLSPDSLQGDRVCARHLESLCAGRPRIDLRDCPDLGPVLFAVAAAKNGGHFTGTRRLKFKESDRTDAMARELAALGAAVTVAENSVTVEPATLHRPARPLWGHNDHRVVMALAVLLTLTGGELHGAQAVQKSFPDFFETLQTLGIGVEITGAGQ